MHYHLLAKDLWSDKMVETKVFPPLQYFKRIFSGFYVRPGTETLVNIKASRTEMRQDAIDFFSDPKYRMCYTEDQFQPLYYNKVL